ncbi:hypothetical protein BJ138DRAFT_974428, partial [Hygrophoropsis aurantiaca]
MVNPGAFGGSQKDFLMAEKPGYALVIKGHYLGDFLSNLTHCYFKRYPITLPHDEEPSPDVLASVDDDVPDPE